MGYDYKQWTEPVRNIAQNCLQTLNYLLKHFHTVAPLSILNQNPFKLAFGSHKNVTPILFLNINIRVS